MLILATVIFMLILGIAYWRAGVFTAFCMFASILLAGVITFNFWEPLANLLEPALKDTPIKGFEDFIVMAGLFIVTLLILRVVVNLLNSHRIEYHAVLDQFGGAFVGLLAGYFLSGFLICAVETLPLHENFLGFEPKSEKDSILRAVMPSDRAWLALMRQVGSGAFGRRLNPVPDEDLPYGPYHTFDPKENFEERYRYLRRHGNNRPPLRMPRKSGKNSKE